MGSVLVVIIEVCQKDSAQMAFNAVNDMISAFTLNASIQSLNIRVWRCNQLHLMGTLNRKLFV